ncbi:unnamed protein product [Polarella glacialis]|uniref:Uncharacterized protein n=1 Tax=Polarella glacialis TaxID=89957 RepID=A0A813D2Q4_POLGL|nr:unnamed protein product [Polarella glacialis]
MAKPKQLPLMQTAYSSQFHAKPMLDLSANRELCEVNRKSGAGTMPKAHQPFTSTSSYFDFCSHRPLQQAAVKVDPRAGDSLLGTLGREFGATLSQARETYSWPEPLKGGHAEPARPRGYLDMPHGRPTDGLWKTSYSSEFGWTGKPRRRKFGTLHPQRSASAGAVGIGQV